MGLHLDVYYRIEGPFHFEADPVNWAGISLLAPRSSRLVLGMSWGADTAGNVGSIRMTLVGICLLVALVVALETRCEVVSAGIWSSRQELTYFGRAGRPRDCLGACKLP